MPANALRHQTKAVINQWASFSVKVLPVALAAKRNPSGKVSHFMLRSSAEGRLVAEQNLSQQLMFQQVSESREGAKPDGKDNTENVSLQEVSAVGCSCCYILVLQ